VKPIPISEYLSRHAPDNGVNSTAGAKGARFVRAFLPSHPAPLGGALARQLPPPEDALEFDAPDAERLAPQSLGQASLKARDAALSQLLEERLSEAFERGREEGLSAARQEAEAVRATEVAEFQERLEAESLRLRQAEIAGVAETIASGLAEIERRISDSIARVLAPFVRARLANQIVDEFASAMARLRGGPSATPIVLRGHPFFLGALRGRAAELGLSVDFVEDEEAPLALEAGDTTIESLLETWTQLIQEAEA